MRVADGRWRAQQAARNGASAKAERNAALTRAQYEVPDDGGSQTEGDLDAVQALGLKVIRRLSWRRLPAWP